MLSEDLKKIYSSNPNDKRFYETVEVSHSMFSKVFYLVKDNENHTWILEDDSVVEFVSYPFEIVLPEAGSTQQDLSFSFDNTSLEIMNEVENAAQKIDEAIKLKYRVFIDGSDTAQTAVVELSLTNIIADTKTISGIATRPDLFKKYFPFGAKTVFDKRFKGLFL